MSASTGHVTIGASRLGRTQQPDASVNGLWAENKTMPQVQKTAQSLRVLVVEDNWFLGVAFAETLEGLGHSVCAIAATEQLAVEATQLHQPALIVVDVGLGHGSGIAAMDTILRMAFVPHVYITGDIAALLALRPAAIVIEKPFQEWALVQAIELAMAGTNAA